MREKVYEFKTVMDFLQLTEEQFKRFLPDFASWFAIRKKIQAEQAALNDRFGGILKITPEQQQAIQSAVQQAHHRTGLHWQEIYRQLKSAFKVAKYDQIPQSQFGNAMSFIMNLQPIALPPAEERFTFDLTKEEISNLTLLLFSHGQMNWLLGKLVKPLEVIGSSYSPTVYGHHTEYKRFYDKSLPLARKLIEPLKQAHRADFEHLLYRLSAN